MPARVNGEKTRAPYRVKPNQVMETLTWAECVIGAGSRGDKGGRSRSRQLKQ